VYKKKLEKWVKDKLKEYDTNKAALLLHPHHNLELLAAIV